MRWAALALGSMQVWCSKPIDQFSKQDTQNDSLIHSTFGVEVQQQIANPKKVSRPEIKEQNARYKTPTTIVDDDWTSTMT